MIRGNFGEGYSRTSARVDEIARRGAFASKQAKQIVPVKLRMAESAENCFNGERKDCRNDEPGRIPSRQQKPCDEAYDQAEDCLSNDM